jgi:hypothetical protein
MDKRAGPVAEISLNLKKGEVSFIDLLINTHKQAGPVADF